MLFTMRLLRKMHPLAWTKQSLPQSKIICVAPSTSGECEKITLGGKKSLFMTHSQLDYCIDEHTHIFLPPTQVVAFRFTVHKNGFSCLQNRTSTNRMSP